MDQARLDDGVRRRGAEVAAGKGDAAGPVHHAGKRPQQGGLAGGVGAEDDDLTGMDLELSVERRLQVAVKGAEPAHGEQKRAVTLLPEALSL